MDELRVTAPASSANLGPGFDVLALALELPFEIATAAAVADGGGRYLPLEATHPGYVAYLAAGGEAGRELCWRSPIPPGRGLGFSGAARVAGAYLARRQMGEEPPRARAVAYETAAGLEGHRDNAAASAHGGFCVAAPEAPLRLPTPEGLLESLRVVAWSPGTGTSTKAARLDLATSVPLLAAVRAIAGTATWVAAMASGRTELLRAACRDELHQPHRLAARPDSAAVLTALVEREEVLAAWLSGSGPTVAALVDSERATGLATWLSRAVAPSPDGAAGTLPAGRVSTLTPAGRGVRSNLD